MSHGYIYVLERNGLFKIGASRNPTKRAKTLRAKLLVQVSWIRMFQLEKALHRRFAAKHAHGEWFRLSAEDVERIKTMSPAIDDYVAANETTIRAVVEAALRNYLATYGHWPKDLPVGDPAAQQAA